MTRSFPDPMTTWLVRLLGLLLGALLLAAGLIFTASLAVAALLIGVVAVAGSLLRGEKPAFRMRWQRGAAPRRAPPGEVVDIEAREIVEPPPALDEPAPRRGDAPPRPPGA